MTTDEAVLFQRWVRARDAEAFAHLASHYAGLIYGTCRRVLGNSSEAEEVAQECLLTLAQTNKPPRENLAAWLHRVAINKSRDRMKSESRRRAREARYAEEQAQDSEAKWNEIEPLIDQAIAELPEELHAVVVAHFIEGKAQADIAEALKVSRQTVTYRVAKGVEQIRAALQRRGVHAGVSLLSAGLAANMAEAAPAVVIAGIGKVAVSGAAGAVVATGVAALIPGVKVAAVVAVLVAATVAGLAWPRNPKISPVTAPPAPPMQSGSTAHAEPVKQTLTAASKSATPSDPANPAADSEANWNVLSGIVLEPDGSPAKPRPQDDPIYPQEHVTVNAFGETKTVGHNLRGEDGKFAITFFEPGETGIVYASVLGDYLVSGVKPFDLVYGGEHRVELTLRPGARVLGTLVDGEGKPISQAKVWAVWEDRMDMGSYAPVTNGLTDAYGGFVVGPLPPGRFVLKARGEGDHNEWRFQSAIAEVTVEEGQTVSSVTLRYNKKWDVIDGHVFDDAGRPLADEVVYADIETDIGVRVSAKTDASGYFSLSLFAPNRARVKVVDRCLMREQDEVRADAGQRGLELVVYDKYALRGRVVNAKTGAPVDKFFLSTSYGARTKSMDFKPVDGGFETTYSGPKDTTFTVQVAGNPGVAQAVSLTDGVNELEFRIDLGDAVRGVIVDEEGKPVAKALVFEQPESTLNFQSDAYRSIAQSDSDGIFAIGSLDASRYSVFVAHEDYVPVEVPIERSGNWIITLARGGSVSGTLIVDGLPAPNHDVQLDYHAGGNRLWTPFRKTQTDSAGRFTFTGLMAGTGKLIVQTKPMGAESSRIAEKEIALKDNEHVDTDIVFERISTVLTGRVITDQATVQGGALLDMDPSGRGKYTRVPLNIDGSFRFEGMPEGYGNLGVTLDGVVPRVHTIPVRIVADQPWHVDVRFTPANATLKGQLLLGGIELKEIDAKLMIRTPDGEEMLRAQLSTPNGVYELSGLPAGKVVMRVDIQAQRGAYGRQYEFELRPNATTVQDIVIPNTTIAFEIAGMKEGEFCHVMGWPGEIDLPDFKQMSGNEAEAYMRANPTAFSGQSGEPIHAIEAGMYTVLAIATDPGGVSNEDEAMAQSRFAVVKVEVPESGDVSVPVEFE